MRMPKTADHAPPCSLRMFLRYRATGTCSTIISENLRQQHCRVCSTVMTSGPRRAYFSGKPRSRAQAAARQYLLLLRRVADVSNQAELGVALAPCRGSSANCGSRSAVRWIVEMRAADVLGGHGLAASHAEDGQDFPLLSVVEHRWSAAFSHEVISLFPKGWHDSERSEGRGLPVTHALRCAQGRATQ